MAACGAAGQAAAQGTLGTMFDPYAVESAGFDAPVARYGHDILGATPEWGALRMIVRSCRNCATHRTDGLSVRLQRDRIFEDIAPRVVDADGDGDTEVIVIESDAALGSRLSIYGADGTLRAATPFVGQPFRWLAPVGQGVGDLDGDGRPEIAYVDRPHLARVLRVWRFDGSELVEVARLEDVTNHRIGEDVITGGFRDCGAGDEALVVSADWTRIVAVTLRDGALVPRDIGAFSGPDDMAAALACR